MEEEQGARQQSGRRGPTGVSGQWADVEGAPTVEEPPDLEGSSSPIFFTGLTAHFPVTFTPLDQRNHGDIRGLEKHVCVN